MDGSGTKDFLIHTAFFCRDLTSVPLFLKKQTAMKCSVVSRIRGRKTWLGYEYKDGMRYFYFNQLHCAGWYFQICCGIGCSIAKSVIINSCIQNNRDNLILDGSETEFSWDENLTQRKRKNVVEIAPCAILVTLINFNLNTGD